MWTLATVAGPFLFTMRMDVGAVNSDYRGGG